MLGRTYEGQNCSVAKTLELVGERWTVLILREVYFGHRRFDEIADGLGIARNVLTQRLQRLVARAVAALAPGGLLVVKDFAVEPDRSGPPEGLYFALNMVAFTRDGDVHDPVVLAAWLRAAGLRDVSVSGLASAPAALLVTGVK